MSEWFYEYLEKKTMKKEGLKPCPFCGEKPKYGNWCGGGGVWCPRCGATIRRDHKPSKTTDDFVLGGDIAVDAWNKRTERDEE